jgi:hypothetical protein
MQKNEDEMFVKKIRLQLGLFIDSVKLISTYVDLAKTKQKVDDFKTIFKFHSNEFYFCSL